jgi:four helix bundle protein
MRNELKDRTKSFALNAVRLVESLPRGRTAEVVGHQLLRSGTSVAANYRSACRARSRRDFIAKMGIVEEEADEAHFWLELIVEHGLLPAERASRLRDEAGQLVAIAVSSIRTARKASASIPHSAFRTPQSQ